MIREERTVFLTLLTFIVYAGLQWLEKGAFLFPFPLNEVTLVVIFIYILVVNRNAITTIFWIYGSVLLFKLLSQQFFWTLFLSHETLEIFFATLWTDIFYICYGLSFLCFSYLYLSARKKKNFILFFCICVGCFIVGLVINEAILELVSLFSIIVYGYRIKPNRIIQAQLVLFLVLEMGKQLMLIY